MRRLPTACSTTLLLLASGLAAQQKPASPTAMAETPKPALGLHAGTWKYQVKVAVRAQHNSFKQITTIAEDKTGWIATEISYSASGETTDSVTLDKTTLIPLRRKSNQGSATISIDFASGKATGTISMGGKDTPLSVDLGGSLFADGPGTPQVIACLPLAEGYTTSFRNFDFQKQKAKLMQLRVTGSETVTVPAGTFDAFKVELSGDRDSNIVTIWVAKQSHDPVKILTTAPAIGGASMTAELLP